MKHTPGPWVVGEPHPTNACAYVRAAGANKGDEIATLYHCSEGGGIGRDGIWPEQPNRDANARLIAAAPDLLAMLKVAQLWLDVDGRFDMQGINAAIAKAEGGAA